MIDHPIFIIGTERSGSNLLRLILNAHPAIAIPHPPHLMRDFSPLQKHYGDLSEDESFKDLIADCIQFVKLHFAPWPFELDAEKIFAAAPTRTLYSIYAGIYEQYRRHYGKTRWGCKSTFMWKQIPEILQHHANPRLIHLVRDPRDVSVSSKKSIFSKFHPYKMARLWAEEQGEIEKWNRLVSEGKLLQVRYEDLTTQPEKEVRRIMEFVGETFEIAQLQYFKGRDAQGLSSLSDSWKNCAQSVSAKSVGQFKKSLSEPEIKNIESAAGELMPRYGYGLIYSRFSENFDTVDLWRIEITERLLKSRAEAQALLTDRNFFLRWRKWLFLQKLKLGV